MELIINRDDTEQVKKQKIYGLAMAYGDQLYNACKKTNLCSAEIKEFITQSMCISFAFNRLQLYLSDFECGRLSIDVSLGHILEVSHLAEAKLNATKHKDDQENTI